MFSGKVGTGFQREAAALLKTLVKMEQSESPFAPVGLPIGLSIGDALRASIPTLVCEVAFMEWTGHGHIRHGSFQGMRPYSDPRKVVQRSLRLSLPSSRFAATPPGRLSPRVPHRCNIRRNQVGCGRGRGSRLLLFHPQRPARAPPSDARAIEGLREGRGRRDVRGQRV